MSDFKRPHRVESTAYVPLQQSHFARFPSNMPHEDDDESPSSEQSDSSTLLETGMQLEDADYGKRSLWERVVAYIRPSRLRWKRKGGQNEGADCLDCEKRMVGRRKASRRCMRIGGGILLLLGIFQLIVLLTHIPLHISPSPLRRILQHWGTPGHIGFGLSHYPTDFTRDIRPIPCHSHNDYWRMAPLYSALEAGCISVEADIWKFDNDDELYVGHDTASLTQNRTLKNLYIDPLLKILEGQNPTTSFFNGTQSLNGVFDTTPEQTLVLLIDLKTAGETLWPHLLSALQPLRSRGFLSSTNTSHLTTGPITVVGTGNTPFHLLTANPDHDIFFDAPLSEMSSPSSLEETYTPLNSFYASAAIAPALGTPIPETGHLTPTQLATLRAQLRGAHSRGLKARYWELPFWPIGLRNRLWEVLVEEGVDVLNVDDLRGASGRDWGAWKGWWVPEGN